MRGGGCCGGRWQCGGRRGVDGCELSGQCRLVGRLAEAGIWAYGGSSSSVVRCPSLVFAHSIRANAISQVSRTQRSSSSKYRLSRGTEAVDESAPRASAACERR